MYTRLNIMSDIYRVMFYQHNSNAMLEIVSQGYYGIMSPARSPHDGLVVNQTKEIWSWNYGNDNHCM